MSIYVQLHFYMVTLILQKINDNIITISMKCLILYVEMNGCKIYVCYPALILYVIMELSVDVLTV
jgi:hypothetical protein